MTIEYTPRGVCSRFFSIKVEDGVIQSVQIIGGCDGNLLIWNASAGSQRWTMPLTATTLSCENRKPEIRRFPAFFR